MSRLLDGMVVLVNGGTQGVGAAVARAAVREGARVGRHDRRRLQHPLQRPRLRLRLELHGSTDSVVAGWDPGSPVRNLTPGEAYPPGPAHQFFMDRFADAYRAELATFLRVATGNAESPCTPAEALEVAWIAEAATHSLREHRPVRMAEIRG